MRWNFIQMGSFGGRLVVKYLKKGASCDSKIEKGSIGESKLKKKDLCGQSSIFSE